MILKTKLTDPLQELKLDGFTKLNELLKINHHSPTSSSMPEGIYAFRYLFSTQEQRREFEGNANMAAGVAVNDAIQWHYSHDIWSFNPNKRKLAPHKNTKLSKEEAIAKAMDKFKEYVPVNDKDREKKEHFLETIPQTIQQGFLAFEKLNILKSEKVVAEDSINHIDHRLSLPIVGRTDVHFTDFNVSERSDAASSQSFISSDAPFLSVCELKTSWQRPGKVRKTDGIRSFSLAKLPSTPNVNHLQQLAFYCFSLRKLNRVLPYLIYLTADDHIIFTEKNCADLEIQNLNNYYEQLVRNCIRKERLLSRYIDLEEPDMILAEIAKDVEPGFDHQFYWNIGAKHLARAKKIWSKI